MSPFSLSDDELDQVVSLAADARGVGLLHREAVKLQRFWASAPAVRSTARGVTSRYR
jgi:hypothetical protein